MSSVIVVPGLHDSGPQHWQSVWQRRFTNAVRVEQAHWDRPDLSRWSANVERVLDTVDDCWIVAHSFGCLATVHALARRGDAQGNVRGIFLVAPADPDKFGIAARLPSSPLAVPGRLVASLTDPWLAWSRAVVWAERWQLPALCAGDAGHINVESGHGAWWQGWNWFAQLRDETRVADWRVVPEQRRVLPLAI